MQILFFRWVMTHQLVAPQAFARPILPQILLVAPLVMGLSLQTLHLPRPFVQLPHELREFD